MKILTKLLPVVAVLAAGAACGGGRYSDSAFNLPPDGNVENGKIAFVSLGCNSCHQVAGVELPGPSVTPRVPVVLGGEVIYRFSDSYIVTSMIHPSLELAPYPRDQVASGGKSRMPAYTDRMTVRQLADVVAFLQAHYNSPREEVNSLTY